jgi:hypothetical protein
MPLGFFLLMAIILGHWFGTQQAEAWFQEDSEKTEVDRNWSTLYAFTASMCWSALMYLIFWVFIIYAPL